MSERPAVDAKDLPAEIRKRLGLKPKARKSPVRSMTMHEVRTYAIRVLAVMADLTPAERSRVLRQAGRMNEV